MNKYGWMAFAFCLFLMALLLSANLDLAWLRRVARFSGFDKAGHFFLFGFLAFLVNKSLSCRKIKLFGNSILLGSFCVLSVVFLEELSQIFIDSRTFDVTDMMYDGVGIYLGGFIAIMNKN